MADPTENHDTLRAIVKGLADLSAPLNDEHSACVLCAAYPPPEGEDPDDVETEEGVGWHQPTCPWRMAREATDG